MIYVSNRQKISYEHDIGAFKTDGQLLFSDPCDEHNESKVLSALPGVYTAKAGLFIDDAEQFEYELFLEFIEIQKEVQKLVLVNDDIHHMKKFCDLLFSNKEDLVKAGPRPTIYEFKKYCMDKMNLNEYYMTDQIIQIFINKFSDLYNKKHLFYIEKDVWLLQCIGNSFDYYNDEVAGLFDEPYSERIEKRINDKKAKYAKNFEGKMNRVAYLHIKHESLNEYTSFDSDLWQESNIDVYINSGMCGIYDSELYKTYSNGAEIHEAEYHKICNLIHSTSNHKSCIIGSGVVASTSYGDCIESPYIIKNDKGEVIEALYHYLQDVYGEDEDDE